MKILVVKLSSLGDILHLFPAISDLHKSIPTAEIHWLIEPAFAEVAGWHSAINKVIPVALRSYKKTWWKIPSMFFSLRKKLQLEHYDAVLDAQGLLKSALIARLAGAPVFGFHSDSARESLASWFYEKHAKVPEDIHVIEKNRYLVSQIFDIKKTSVVDYGLDIFGHNILQNKPPKLPIKFVDRPFIMLLHGTTWDSKYWSESSWIELIRLLAERGWHCLVPWGNEAEYQRAKRFEAAATGYVFVLEKLSLTELMSLLLRSHAFVSVESGIGHLASALNIRGVMLHGPTSPNYSGILEKSCFHIVSEMSCSPCFKRSCPILNNAGIPPCQQAITPQRVISFLSLNDALPSMKQNRRADLR